MKLGQLFPPFFAPNKKNYAEVFKFTEIQSVKFLRLPVWSLDRQTYGPKNTTKEVTFQWIESNFRNDMFCLIKFKRNKIISHDSGRILDEDINYGGEYDPAATSTPTPIDQPGGILRPAWPVNTHSGVLYTTNNNFSWLTLAKFQNEDTLRNWFFNSN